ncbi:hypothetical protein ACFX1R_015929 [Malus domestica]
MNESGKKRSSPPVQEMPIEKKLKISFAAREGPPAAKRLVIDITSSNEKKNGAAKSKSVALATTRMASTIADKIAHHRGLVMPLVLKLVPRRLL